jgi:hypothetical protein
LIEEKMRHVLEEEKKGKKMPPLENSSSFSKF